MAPQGALRADMASANPNFTSIHRSSCSPSPPAYGRIISSNRLAAHPRKGSSSTQRSRIIWLRKDAAFQSFSGLRPAHLAPSRQLKACDKRILRGVVCCDASKISQGEFTEMAWQAVVGLPEVAKESNQQIVETEDLMKALLEQRNGLVRRIFAKANVDNTFLYQAIERCIQRQSKVHLRRSLTGFFWSRKFGGKDLLVLGGNSSELMSLPTNWCLGALLVAASNFPVFLSFTDAARAESSHQEVHQIYGDLSSGIELGVQVLYLAFLLSLVGVASFFVVRQLLIRRELETAARDLQDRVRTGEALPVEYFELGAVMLRKKFFVLASKYLEQAINKWDGDPQDLAQVHNALGYSLVCDNKLDKGIAEYEKAVKLQPGYVVAWNNLGSAYEKKKNLPKALQAYEQALLFDPNNRVAREYRDALKKRVDRLAGVPTKYD